MSLNIYSFTSDERAILEPNNDIISTALVVIGFVVFAAILSKTYMTFNDSSHALEKYEQAALIAEDIASSVSLTGSRPELISAEKLDRMSKPSAEKERYIFFQPFSPDLDFYVEVCTDDGNYEWVIDEGKTFPNGRDVIAASVPVVIELGSTARCVPGTITVKVMQKRWE